MVENVSKTLVNTPLQIDFLVNVTSTTLCSRVSSATLYVRNYQRFSDFKLHLVLSIHQKSKLLLVVLLNCFHTICFESF